MDHRGKALLASFALTAAALSAAALAADKLPFRAMAWLTPEGWFEALSSEQTSGFRISQERLFDANQIAAGQVLFHTPLLLGGQAAKAGLSCASCHVNGRDNPHFRFPGVSGGAGTADVTHSFFSSHRGDGEFNPVPIPDLTQTGKISRDMPGELEAFTRGLIVEEFDGAEPSPAALEAIAAYVRALRAVCRSERQQVSLETHLRRAKQAVATAGKYQKNGPELARLLLSGARHQLSLIHERYAGDRLDRERKALVVFSNQLRRLQEMTSGKTDQFQKSTRAAQQMLDDLQESLQNVEDQSLYNPERLAAALEK